jgi:hypothetical protein
LYVVLVTLAGVVIIDCIYLLSQRLLPAPVDFIEGLKILKPQGVWSFLITFLGICVVVPIAEELVFRGIVQRVFSRNMNPIIAFILAGIVFGGIHLDAHLLISISCFGIILGFIFYATNNLTYTILSHAVFNTVAFVQLSTTSPDLLETPPFYVRDVRFIIVSAILLFFFLRKIKKGGSYKETP